MHLIIFLLQGEALNLDNEGKTPETGKNEHKNKSDKPVKIRRGDENRKWKTAVIVGVIVTICIAAAIVIVTGFSDFTGIGGSSMQKDVTIQKGWGASEISEALAQNGVIKSTVGFNLYVKFFKKDAAFNYGIYTLSSDMGYDRIIEELEKVATRKPTATVTIPEGFNVYEIAKALEEKGVCKADAFINAIKTGTYDYDFIKAIPDDANRFLKLEGYLFPDTYNFEFESDPKTVVKTMLDNFNKKITPTLKARAKEMNMTLDQVVIMASIIQSEVGGITDAEKPVSSVFHNRLNDWKDYPFLESDVTIFYGRDVISANDKAAPQSMIDAYNTYVHKGLTAGAICNPGISSINAALYPASTDYYYFVTDINGKFYFATDFTAHKKNVAYAASVLPASSASQS